MAAADDRLPRLKKLLSPRGPAPKPAAKQAPKPAAQATGFDFDALSDDELELLQAAAEAAESAGLLPGPESGDGPESRKPPKPGAKDEGGAGEEPKAKGGPAGYGPGEDAEGEAAAGGGDAGAQEGPETLLSLAQAAASELAGYVDQIEELQTLAEQMRAGKPAKVAAIGKKIQKLAEDAQKASDEAEKAFGDGSGDPDVKGLAVAYAEADELCREGKELLAEAEVAAGKTPADDGQGGPEGGEGEAGDVEERTKSPGKGKGPKGPEKRRSALASWASR